MSGLIFQADTHQLGIKYDHAPDTVLGSIGVYLFDPEDCDGDTFVVVAILGYWLCDTKERMVEPDLYEFTGAQAKRIVEMIKGSDAPIWRNVALYVIADLIWEDAESEIFVEMPLIASLPDVPECEQSPEDIEAEALEILRRAA